MAECFTVEVAWNAPHIDGSLLKRPWLIHLLNLEWNKTKDMRANDFFFFFKSYVVDNKNCPRKYFPFHFSVSSRQERFTTQMEEPADDEGSSISFSPVRAPMTLCRITA
jgi:hypothetical protein